MNNSVEKITNIATAFGHLINGITLSGENNAQNCQLVSYIMVSLNEVQQELTSAGDPTGKISDSE